MTTEKEGLSLVPLADFDACALEAPIAALNQVDMPSLSIAYQQALATTPSPCKEVFRLLSEITGIHLNPAERGRIWGPGFSFNNRRSMVPSDIRGEQSDVLEEVLPRIKHPALRARIADIVWTNDMRKGAVAETAITAYCDCVTGLMDGSLKAAYPVDGCNLVDALTPAHRALQIASATTKRSVPLRDRGVVLTTLYCKARNDGQPVIFSRIAQLCVDYKFIEAKQVATDLETAANAKPDVYPEAIRMALDFAGLLYKRANDLVSEQRCQIGAVRQMLRMRDECSQAGAKASWVMDALLRLRHIKCEEGRLLENDLEDELRRLQRASLRETGTFEVNIDVPAERDRIIKMFSEMDFSTVLKSFALFDSSPKLVDLKAEALKLGQQFPLHAMLDIKHIDNEGKTAVNTAGAGSGDPPDDSLESLFTEQLALLILELVPKRIELMTRDD
jgi:hypothetical protein